MGDHIVQDRMMGEPVVLDAVMNHQPLWYFTGDQVRRALPMADAIEAMRDAFTQLALGNITMAPRTQLDVAESRGVVLLMPCQANRIQRMSLKMVHQYPENRASGLPLIQALVFLSDAANGQALALMDGAALTAIRTGAGAGLATQVLARPTAQKAAIFGAGVQARTQLEAVCAVRPIRHVHVFDQDAERAQKFASEMSERLGIEVAPVASSAQALHQALVVCTATTSATPVFTDAELAPGAHINGVGSWRPDTAEIPAETVNRARVYVDHREAALEEAGDLLIPLREGRFLPDQIQGTLGEVLINRVSGRRNQEEITFFKSVGLAVQDLFAAARVFENARRLGLGLELPR